MTRHPGVALCTITYLRPVGLARLLERIADMDTAGVSVEVIVIDNDAERSAESIVEAARGRLGDVTYAVEARRGITYARNAALEIALERDLDWIGWIDDDEAPRKDWLVRMLETQSKTGADVVFGPSEPIFESGGSVFVAESGAFNPERFTTGGSYPYFHTATSGVILRSSVVPDERFDDSLALTGGEDTVFFTRIHRAGGRFVYDDRAVVDEWVPASRQTVKWLVRRWFRTGVTRSSTMLILDNPSWPRRLRRVAGGLTMAARGVLAMTLAAPLGRTSVFLASRTTVVGVGASVGALGFHYSEYRSTHGR